ncbi:hypothetical protein CYLTODRAFT_425527 [Cylindrobasidium torrendii FP15055 ss-10]|uniref:3-oxo-5-alpha-steroid 4-dehydrogenase C-terminal domain-containing protein n=1 Tax=Cylindrobasidium torrendii FP15055 ss-10 TaxID=1314674 RepID=A0A0D7B3H6_9AGAR|nr:hypothetical protein CYLTODRAFT_425527 [Cylindrobasidium torrendii FP15055 ss-10]
MVVNSLPDSPLELYNAVRKWFTLGSCLLFVVTFKYKAPFGRFSRPSLVNIMLDGRKSWIIMEIVSPLCFLYSYITSPLGGGSLSLHQQVLASAYLIHYTNRALISPLTSPPRSKSSILVCLAGIVFNIMNGNLMGTYISSNTARTFLDTVSTTRFVLGLSIWAVGFALNIKHDNILMDIRRSPEKNDPQPQVSRQPHYAIPHGWLYRYISFPNYFCEWVEWWGFALAASRVPIPPSLASVGVFTPATQFYPTLTPPWIFLFNEVVLMFPRAWTGQQWYREKFGDKFPKERKIVIPFLL